MSDSDFGGCGVVRATREMLPHLLDLDRREHGDEAWSKAQWLGVIELQRDGDTAAFAAVDQVGPQQLRIFGVSVFAREPGDATPPRWKLHRVTVAKSWRRSGAGTDLANQIVGGDAAAEVIADVHERRLGIQQFLRGAGWVGFPLTRLDGEGVIRFRRERITRVEPADAASRIATAEEKPAAKKQRAKKTRRDGDDPAAPVAA